MASPDLRAILQKAGFKGSRLETALAIAHAESGGDPAAHNGNRATGDNSYGLFQINMLGAMGPERLRQYGLRSNADLLDPATNARVAFEMSKGGKNWEPWSTYKSGAYKQYLGAGADTTMTGGSMATPKVDKIDRAELAAEYGWALSVLKSSPDLEKLFNQAVKNTWTPQRFVAELRNTKWFQTHSENARNAQVLRTSDPATWNAKVNQTRALVRDAAVQMGAQIPDASLNKIVNNVLTYGWNDAQIRDTLAGSVKAGAQGTYGGQAAADVDQLRTLAASNGVKLGDQTLNGWVQRIASGESINGFEEYVKQMASSAFPQFADHIAAGKTVKDIADPYINQMANTLEIDPATIDLFDPTIRKTLQATDPADGKPMSKPLWAFERDLKQDPRWRTTNNARDELMGAGQQVLRDFGLA